MIKHEYTDQNNAEGHRVDYMCGCAKGELLGPCEHAEAHQHGERCATWNGHYLFSPAHCPGE